MISKPSASDCIIPYSIPLWTIFTKWPAPDGADVRVAALLGQVLRGTARSARTRRRRRRPSRSSPPSGPRPRRRRRRRGTKTSFFAASAARRCESRKFELPPSTMTSPSSSSAEQRLEGVLGRVARRDHQPHDARLRELRGELDQRVGRALRVRPRVGLHRVAVLAQPLHHVRAHPAEADHSEVHAMSSSRIARDRTAALLQRRVVSRSLRVDEAAEAELLPGDRQLVARVVDDLEEAADRRAALVQLARSSAGSAGPRPKVTTQSVCCADPLDERPEPLLLGRVDERLDRDVVARLAPARAAPPPTLPARTGTVPRPWPERICRSGPSPPGRSAGRTG